MLKKFYSNKWVSIILDNCDKLYSYRGIKIILDNWRIILFMFLFFIWPLLGFGTEVLADSGNDSGGQGPAPPETPEESSSGPESDISLDSGVGDPVSEARAAKAAEENCRPHDIRWSQRLGEFTFTQEYMWDHPEDEVDNPDWDTEEAEAEQQADNYHSDYDTDHDRPRPAREDSPPQRNIPINRERYIPIQQDDTSEEENAQPEDNIPGNKTGSEADTEGNKSPEHPNDSFWQYPSDSGNEAEFSSDSDSGNEASNSSDLGSEKNTSGDDPSKDKSNRDSNFNNKKREYEPDSDSDFQENKRRKTN